MSTDLAPTLPPAWQQMLARVEQALAAAVADASHREEALRAALPASPAPDLSAGLASFGERVRGLGTRAERAARTVAEIDGALAAGEDALRAWFQAAEVARGKLAGWAGRA